MPQTLAFVTPKLIEWARRRYNLSPAAAAAKINVRSISAERISAWEAADSHPTFPQARNLAAKLHVPFGFLFLSEPPSLAIPLPDLRTVTGEPLAEPSPDFVDLTYDVLRKQGWFREYRESIGAEPLPFIGRFSLGADPKEIAADMATVLRVDARMRNEATSWEEFLRRFIRQAEAAGVLVIRSGVVEMNNTRPVSVEEFRGFAISDHLAPLVFVNGQDAKAAQIFTLAHELAHLWVGESGISNPNFQAAPGEQVNQIDRLCDKTAVELLVPEADFLLRWNEDETIKDNLEDLAHHYRVSAITILRRALETTSVTRSEFGQTYTEITEEPQPPRRGEGGNFYYNLLARNSTTFTATVVTAVAAGQVTEHDAARLLNVRVRTLGSIRKHLSERGIFGA